MRAKLQTIEAPKPVEDVTIPLDAEDIKVYAKHLPDIERGRKAEGIVHDYVKAILRRSGVDPRRPWQLIGKNIVVQQEPIGGK